MYVVVLFKLGLQVGVDDTVDLLPTLWICPHVPPFVFKFSESWSFPGRSLALDEIHKVLSDLIRDGLLTQHGFVVVLDKVLHSGRGFTIVGVIVSYTTELVIHARIKVAYQEMGPKLVQILHVIVAHPVRRLLTLLDCVCTKQMVRLMGQITWKRVDRQILVLKPQNRRDVAVHLTLW